MRLLRSLGTNWRIWVFAAAGLLEWALIRWAGGVDSKSWAPSIGANVGTMLVAAFGVEFLIRRESRKKAEQLLQLNLLQVWTAISYAMGVLHAPDIYPHNVIDGMMQAWPTFARGLADQIKLVSAELEVETRAELSNLQSQMGVVAPFLTAKNLTSGDNATAGFVLQTWVAFRRIWTGLYPREPLNVAALGDGLVTQVEEKLRIKLEDVPAMSLNDVNLDGTGRSAWWRRYMSAWNKNTILWLLVIVCFLLAGVCALWLRTWSATLWAPSLACNFLTTGIAILVINLVVAGAAARDRARRKAWAQNRKQLKENRRRARRTEAARLLSGTHIVSTLELGLEVMDVAQQRDLQGVLGHIKDRQKTFVEHAWALEHLTLVFNRFFTLHELDQIEALRRAVRWLATEVDHCESDDVHKVHLMEALEAFNAYAMAIGMGTNNAGLLQLQGDYNHKLGALRRKWAVPEIRKRLREEAETRANAAQAPPLVPPGTA